MATAAAAMIAVATHPNPVSQPPIANSTMIFEFPVSIISAIAGTATIPLMTAHQYSALMGLTGAKLRRTPTTVASTVVA